MILIDYHDLDQELMTKLVMADTRSENAEMDIGRLNVRIDKVALSMRIWDPCLVMVNVHYIFIARMICTMQNADVNSCQVPVMKGKKQISALLHITKHLQCTMCSS